MKNTINVTVPTSHLKILEKQAQTLGMTLEDFFRYSLMLYALLCKEDQK